LESHFSPRQGALYRAAVILRSSSATQQSGKLRGMARRKVVLAPTAAHTSARCRHPDGHHRQRKAHKTTRLTQPLRLDYGPDDSRFAGSIRETIDTDMLDSELNDLERCKNRPWRKRAAGWISMTFRSHL